MAEVVIAARREQARSVGDVLLRRTRLGLLAARELLADGAEPESSGQARRRSTRGELDWSEQRVAAEVERFLEEARAGGHPRPRLGY